MKWVKKIAHVAIAITIFLVGYIISSNYFITRYSHEKIYTNIHTVPDNEIGVVLGTNKYTTGGINQYYWKRMEATAQLFHSGKIKHIIVSGDNHKHGYNEPEQMKESLIKLGVPSEKITCDYAGFRTFDSVVRLKKVFGKTGKITIISQKFHLQRALFIARHFNMDAVGFCAQDVAPGYNTYTQYREWLAKAKAGLDLYVLKTQPRYLGPAVHIPL